MRRPTFYASLRFLRLWLGDLHCWLRHTHDVEGRLALCPCGREWWGDRLTSRNFRAPLSPEERAWNLF
jgi:hypothetical protein